MTLTGTTKLVLGFLALGLLAFLAWFAFIRPAHDHQVAAQAKTSDTFAQAQTQAGAEVLNEMEAYHGSVARIHNQTQESSNAINSAPGAAAPIDPGLDAAGRRALCLHDNPGAWCQSVLHPDGGTQPSNGNTAR